MGRPLEAAAGDATRSASVVSQQWPVPRVCESLTLTGVCLCDLGTRTILGPDEGCSRAMRWPRETQGRHVDAPTVGLACLAVSGRFKTCANFAQVQLLAFVADYVKRNCI